MKLNWPKNNKIKYLVGIDEVGRGPLAGPVTLGIFILDKKSLLKFNNFLKTISLKDSKQLSHIKRVEILNKLKATKFSFNTFSVSAKQIDKNGISHSIKFAIKNLLKKQSTLNTHIRLDGSLKAPAEFIYQETIIKGDEKDPLIALASIVAKETRDSYMVKLSSEYPKYGFERHKGYGTKAHRTAIKKRGLTGVHRKSYCSKI